MSELPVTDVNSLYSIDNRRVIELYLHSEDGKQEIAAYERGWLGFYSWLWNLYID